jgi:hypothetical protein
MFNVGGDRQGKNIKPLTMVMMIYEYKIFRIFISSVIQRLASCFTLVPYLFFDPEDGGDMFLSKIRRL